MLDSSATRPREAGPFRLAIVGSGQIAAAGHIPAALASSRVRLVALVDPVRDRAEGLLRSFRIEARAVPTLAEVLGEIDGAVIATPNHTHYPLALACIEAGVPVLVEKPLATSVLDGERMVRTARDRGVTLAVGYGSRHLESVQLLKDLLDAGFFGKVRRFVYQLGMADWAAPLSGYSFDVAAAGGGVLMVNGSHFIDRMLYWFGSPARWEYSDDACGGPEANAEALFHFDGAGFPFEGAMRLSKTLRTPSGFVLETEKGTAILPEDSTREIRFRPRDHPAVDMVLTPRLAAHELATSVFQRQLEDFVESCREGRSPMVSGEHGLESLRLIESLYASRGGIPRLPDLRLSEAV